MQPCTTLKMFGWKAFLLLQNFGLWKGNASLHVSCMYFLERESYGSIKVYSNVKCWKIQDQGWDVWTGGANNWLRQRSEMLLLRIRRATPVSWSCRSQGLITAPSKFGPKPAEGIRKTKSSAMNVALRVIRRKHRQWVLSSLQLSKSGHLKGITIFSSLFPPYFFHFWSFLVGLFPFGRLKTSVWFVDMLNSDFFYKISFVHFLCFFLSTFL